FIRNRTFFLGSFEGLKQRDGTTRISVFPTAAERNGDLSAYAALNNKVLIDPLTGQPFSNNVIPAARIDPISRRILETYPDPNNPSDPVRNFIVAPSVRIDNSTFLVRADHHFSDKQQLVSRWAVTDSVQFTPGEARTNALPVIGDSSRTNRYQNGVVG